MKHYATPVAQTILATGSLISFLTVLFSVFEKTALRIPSHIFFDQRGHKTDCGFTTYDTVSEVGIISIVSIVTCCFFASVLCDAMDDKYHRQSKMSMGSLGLMAGGGLGIGLCFAAPGAISRVTEPVHNYHYEFTTSTLTDTGIALFVIGVLTTGALGVLIAMAYQRSEQKANNSELNKEAQLEIRELINKI